MENRPAPHSAYHQRPRQVGKTETIDHFAARNYHSVVGINFVEEPKYRAITADGYGADTIIRNISLINPTKKFIPGETLLFFDEIQAHPDIATRARFLRSHARMVGTSRSEIEKGTAKSMRTLISSDSYPEIQFGVKLSASNIGSSEHVFTAPYFATFLLRRLLRAFDEGHAPLLDNPSR